MTVWHASVFHAGAPPFFIAETISLDHAVTLRLRAADTAPITAVYVRSCPDGEQHFDLMTREESSDDGLQWWQVRFTPTMPRSDYRFWLMTDHGGWWFSQAGLQRSTPRDATDFQLICDFAAPDWVTSAVFYQIFPDRFADGDPHNNVQTGAYLAYGKPVEAREWGLKPRSHAESGAIEFFGGDLQGITQHLAYLEDLGINAIYLNPIFTAPSNHKYDTANYYQVDPHLGGEQALIDLRQKMHTLQMHLILDIVLNHCGATNSWFTAAQADQTAATADYFIWYDHPKSYEAWWNVPWLPKLNYTSTALRKQIYADPDSIVRYWLKPPFAIDGWRIDVANMMARQGANQLGHKIGRALRRSIKAENPQAYMLGEHFYDATPHLGGDELDASMNYRGFALPLLQWLTRFDTAHAREHPWADVHALPTVDFITQLQTFLAVIPWQIAVQQFNMLNSHDTPRLLTIVDENIELLKVAVLMQMSYPGVPCIYYGDEIGLTGGDDPSCRGCMPWDPAEWNSELRTWYQQVINLRRTESALQQGSLQWVWQSEDGIAFVRQYGTEQLLTIALRQPHASITIALGVAGIQAQTAESLLDDKQIDIDTQGQLQLTGMAQASIWRLA